MDTPAIQCRNLSKSYGAVSALSALDLSVAPGSVFGFLGRNGAGKSTTMRLLTGLARPSAGEAWVEGTRIELGEIAGRDKFGFLPEEPAFFEWMTPRQFLTFIGALFLIPADTLRVKVENLLEEVGLAPQAARPIKGFSRGMRQRLGLAQALVHSPTVLFLDEPTSALDPAGRKDVLDLIEGLRGRVTVFLSSHILDDIERVCDTVGILHQGRLVTVSSPESLQARHPSSTIALELEGGALTPALQAELRARPWVQRLEFDNRSGAALLRVSDAAAARRELLPWVLGHGIDLRRYEWLRPSLEDVFLEISA